MENKNDTQWNWFLFLNIADLLKINVNSTQKIYVTRSTACESGREWG